MDHDINQMSSKSMLGNNQPAKSNFKLQIHCKRFNIIDTSEIYN
jgi:hypothetical protein